MISEALLDRLVDAASRAPSPDNMQAWSFAAAGDAIDVYVEPSRVLPTDVDAMFAWVGLGAAVENLAIAARGEGFGAAVDCRALGAGGPASGGRAPDPFGTPVTVRLSPPGPDHPSGPGHPLAGWIERRETNRGPYDEAPLDLTTLRELTRAADRLDAGVHWVSDRASLESMASMDARSSYIRLEHRPLHDELFDILRFSRRSAEEIRFGLGFESLGVPSFLVWAARLLRYPSVMKVVSRLGIGRFIARRLAARLRTAGAVCLVTARRNGPAGYVEAGRAMERLWLAATARGLAVQPYGVLPQYLTKLDVEPEGFLPCHAEVMRGHREPFAALFPGARSERPAIVLRVGRPRDQPSRRSPRLPVDRLIRSEPGARQ
jgi:nitroreductase